MHVHTHDLRFLPTRTYLSESCTSVVHSDEGLDVCSPKTPEKRGWGWTWHAPTAEEGKKEALDDSKGFWDLLFPWEHTWDSEVRVWEGWCVCVARGQGLREERGLKGLIVVVGQ